MKKKKLIAVILAAVVVIALVVLGVLFGPKLLRKIKGGGASASEGVYVDNLGTMLGLQADVSSEVFSGVAEMDKPNEVKKDAEKEVKEILVKEGDTVHAGDPLFTYDVDAMDLKLRQLQIDLDGMTNRIETLNAQLAGLQKEKEKAPQDKQLSYSLEIQSAELEIRTEEYNKTLKQAEIDALQKSIDNATVYSEYDGTITALNPDEGTDSQGNPLPFMSIQGNDEFQIKCTCSELTIGGIYEGMPMSVTARVDESQTWTGVIARIDRENAVQDNNMMWGGMDNGAQKAAKYYFYIKLDNADGVMAGQHVYAKLAAEGEGDSAKIWIPSYLLLDPETDPALFVEGADGTIRRQNVTLGEYNPEMDSWELVSGVELSDNVAFPDDSVKEGMPALHYSDGFSTMGTTGEVLE